MLSTYRAILRGETLEWQADRPQNLTELRALPVIVTILDEAGPAPLKDRGQEMAAALEQLAHEHSLLASIDPVQWQRVIREDRPLPERYDATA